VIRRTFQLAPGIGPWREKDLWARGFDGWDAVRAGGAAVLGGKLHDVLCAAIDRAEAALDRLDLAALVRMVPTREHWRLWPLVADEALFLDIEADGVGERHRPTVAGCLDGDSLATFVEGRNLEALPGHLGRRRVWVTFNGACFDLPVLRHAFSRGFRVAPRTARLRKKYGVHRSSDCAPSRWRRIEHGQVLS